MSRSWDVVQTEGNFAETLERATRTLNVDPQTGFAPAIWNTWVNNWTGQEPRLGSENRTAISTVGRTTTTDVFRDTEYLVSSFGEDEAGELYVLHYDIANGRVFRLEAAE